MFNYTFGNTYRILLLTSYLPYLWLEGNHCKQNDARGEIEKLDCKIFTIVKNKIKLECNILCMTEVCEVNEE